jgi:hypothetical protein
MFKGLKEAEPADVGYRDRRTATLRYCFGSLGTWISVDQMAASIREAVRARRNGTLAVVRNLGRHYSRFSLFWPTASPADQPLALRKLSSATLSQFGVAPERQWNKCWLALMLWRELQVDQSWSKRLGSSRKGTIGIRCYSCWSPTACRKSPIQVRKPSVPQRRSGPLAVPRPPLAHGCAGLQVLSHSARSALTREFPPQADAILEAR